MTAKEKLIAIETELERRRLNDCIVIYENQDLFKCILDGQEFSMTAGQLPIHLKNLVLNIKVNQLN